MYPTPERVRIAVQKDIQFSGWPLVAIVTEASNGLNGPTYSVAFQPAEVSPAAEAEPTT